MEKGVFLRAKTDGKDDHMLAVYLAVIDTVEQKSSFRFFCEKYSQDIYKVAFEILNDTHDAEEAVNQALFAIANHYKKVSTIPEQEITSFIVVVARNAAINIYNKNKRRTSDLKEYTEDSAPVKIDYFESFELEELKACISSLPQIYKDVIYLHYFEELSVKEISDMLGISKNTIFKRIERARKLLKAALKEREFYD